MDIDFVRNARSCNVINCFTSASILFCDVMLLPLLSCCNDRQAYHQLIKSSELTAIRT